jgi:hypothetical protein
MNIYNFGIYDLKAVKIKKQCLKTANTEGPLSSNVKCQTTLIATANARANYSCSIF